MNRFKRMRARAGIESVKEAAQKLEISQSMLYAIESSARMPGRKLAVRMCSVYKCTLDDIFLSRNNTNSVKKKKNEGDE